MKFILGEKIKMSQIFDDNGKVIPVTIVKAGPITVTQVKTMDKDKYQAVQFGFGNKKTITKPILGHLKGAGNFRYLKEFKIDDGSALNVGDKIDVSVFKVGDVVNVTGVSKGKGFQGVVRRHHFAGGPASHGHKDNLRMPGAIGAGGMQHVLKGTRMGGRMGCDQITIKNTRIVKIDIEKNLLMLKGGIPGAKTGLVKIKSAI